MDTMMWGKVKHILRRDAQAHILQRASPEPNTGCWLWMRATTKAGYGQLPVDSSEDGVIWNRVAHRLSYEAFIGPIPKGLHLDHLCRERSCVNPAHLEPVTPIENYRRGRGGQFQRDKTRCARGHPYDAENTAVVVKKNGKRSRRCRACNREWSRLSAARAEAKRDVFRARSRAYYGNNKDKEKARKAEWYRTRGKALRRSRTTGNWYQLMEPDSLKMRRPYHG